MARKALELADAHPEAKGDCSYLIYESDGVDTYPTGEGDCIFGQALVALGVDVDWLKGQEGQSIDAVLLHLEGKDADPVPGPLTYAQYAQDEDKAWGHADVRGHLAEFIEEQA